VNRLNETQLEELTDALIDAGFASVERQRLLEEALSVEGQARLATGESTGRPRLLTNLRKLNGHAGFHTYLSAAQHNADSGANLHTWLALLLGTGATGLSAPRVEALVTALQEAGLTEEQLVRTFFCVVPTGERPPPGGTGFTEKLVRKIADSLPPPGEPPPLVTFAAIVLRDHGVLGSWVDGAIADLGLQPDREALMASAPHADVEEHIIAVVHPIDTDRCSLQLTRVLARTSDSKWQNAWSIGGSTQEVSYERLSDALTTSALPHLGLGVVEIHVCLPFVQIDCGPDGWPVTRRRRREPLHTYARVQVRIWERLYGPDADCRLSLEAWRRNWATPPDAPTVVSDPADWPETGGAVTLTFRCLDGAEALLDDLVDLGVAIACWPRCDDHVMWLGQPPATDALQAHVADHRKNSHAPITLLWDDPHRTPLDAPCNKLFTPLARK